VHTALEVAVAESTDATTNERSSMACEMGAASGPELPMQVVQP